MRVGQILERGDPFHGAGSAGFREAEKGRSLYAVLILYVLSMLTFAIFHPVLEWPDAEFHLTKSCQEEVAFPPKELLAALGQDVCAFSFSSSPTTSFHFFSDGTLNADLHSTNPLWFYIFPSLVCLLGLFIVVTLSGNQDAVGNPLIFAPPLAFAISNINIEVFGLFLVIGAYFIHRARPRLALLLAIAATVIDRSHVCSILTLALLGFFTSARRVTLLPVFLGAVLFVYAARLAGLLDILDLLTTIFDSVSLLGVTGSDITYNAEVGSRGYAALFASVAGLYGGMSYRPVLWWLYYPVFFTLFVVGYLLSRIEEKRVFLISLAAAICVMIVLPPLSQARYYPILIISMWTMVLRGGGWFRISSLSSQALFFAWTVVTIIAADLHHIVSS